MSSDGSAAGWPNGKALDYDPPKIEIKRLQVRSLRRSLLFFHSSELFVFIFIFFFSHLFDVAQLRAKLSLFYQDDLIALTVTISVLFGCYFRFYYDLPLPNFSFK